MSYSYRLNVEDIFYKLATDSFAQATAVSGLVNHSRAEDGQYDPFRGYPTDEGLAAAAVAVVAWAISLESFTNLAWNETIAPKLPEGQIRNLVIKQFSTPDKLKEILKSFSVDVAALPWLATIKTLYELRNELVHYKHAVVYQGFSFAPPIARRLSESSVEAVRDAATCAMREIGKLCDLRTAFLDGDYQLADSCG